MAETVPVTPEPGPSIVTPTPYVSPTPFQVYDPPRMLPDEESADGKVFGHVGVLTPYIVGVLFMLLLVLSVTSFREYFRSRRKVGTHDTSALPHKD